MSFNVTRWYQWLPWLSALILVVVAVWLMSIALSSNKATWLQLLDRQQDIQGRFLKSTGHDLTQQAMLLAQLISRDQEAIELIRQAHTAYLRDLQQGTSTLAEWRPRVEQELNIYWGDMKELGVSQLNVFFSPGSTSFLRMQRPNRYGESLSGLRPLIGEAFSSGIPAWGMDITREGSGYTAALPIFDDATDHGAAIALLELTMTSMNSQALEDNGLNMAIFLRRSLIDTLVWGEIQKNIKQLSRTSQEDWILERTSSPLVLEWWEQGQIPINRPYRMLSSRDGKQYLLSWWPQASKVAKISDQAVAMVVWGDISDAYSGYKVRRNEIVARWTCILLVAELLLFAFMRISRRYRDQLIEEHSAEILRENALTEQSRQRLALALRSSESGFWEWDIINDKANFSPEWRDLCGLPPASSSSQDLDEWMSRIHPADKRSSYSVIVSHLKGETPMYENEYRLQVSDGSYKWIFTRGKVVEWLPDGRAAVMLGVYTDITQRKNMELIAIRQQAALHALSEIASLPALDNDELLHHALDLAVHYLGVGSGAIAEIKQGRCQIRIQYSQTGATDQDLNQSLSQSYCSLTVAARDVVAEDTIPRSVLAEHPAFKRTQVESYIGVPLLIGGELYGTLSFTSQKSRQQEYDRLDKDFVRLLGRWVSSVVERWKQDLDKKIILDRFHKLSERLPGFLYQYQLRPDGTSFFPYASPGIKNIYNTTPEEVSLSAEKIFAVIHPEDVGWISETVSYSATHLTPWVATVRVNNPERGLIWTHIQSIPEKLEDGSVLWNGYVSDITSIKQTELELEKINALSQAIFDAANISIISTDVNGIIKTFNHGAEQLLGYFAADMIDRRTMSVFHDPVEIDQRAQELTAELGYEMPSGFDTFVARAREGTEDENEWHYVRKDGSKVPVLLSISALRDYQGEIFGYLGIARDISELKRIDKMKSEFISTVSHELRTPLTAISGALGILTAGALGSMSEKVTRMLEIAYNNSQRLIHLVNDLLDMEKLVAGKMHFELVQQSLLPIIHQSIEANAAYAAQFQVTFKLDEESDDAMVSVDGLRLLQVLANYLSNAAKFSPQHEIVSVCVRRLFGVVRVTVTDKGKGIAPEFHNRIFSKFSQADSSDTRQKGGTGLGLAICKEIIERMGGKVGFDSVPGNGATFYFELPCEDFTRKTPSTLVDVSPDMKRVLIVEDDASIGQVWGSLLKQEGYEYDIVSVGAIAQQYLALRSYDLMILDLQLPDMDGVDIIRFIRDQELHRDNQQKAMPILVISAMGDQAKENCPADLSANSIAWFVKPMQNSLFVSEVKKRLSTAD